MVETEFEVVRVSNESEWEQAYSIRVKVFVEEQNVPKENELDELDPHCVHWFVISRKDDLPVGTIRLFIDESRKGKLGYVDALVKEKENGRSKGI